MFVLVIIAIIFAAIVVALIQGRSVQEGQLVATLTRYEAGTKKVHSRYSYFSNGRIEEHYYTGGPPSVRWSKAEKIQSLLSTLDSQNIWNRVPAIRNPFNQEEKQMFELKYSGDTNRFLSAIRTNSFGPGSRDEAIQVINRGKTNTAKMYFS